MSIDRDISAGNPTMVEFDDDTNNSEADFDAEAPSPEPNDPSGPTEAVCDLKGPKTVQDWKTKVRGGKVTITGTLYPPEPFDHARINLLAKKPAFKKVGGAVDGLGAESRFKVRIPVPDDAKRCKVLVKYRGDVIGEKTFKC